MSGIRVGSEIEADVDVEADVCVVGSGCGGATLALALAERGLSVVILEQGGYYTKRDFDQREADMLAKIDGGRGLSTSDDGGMLLTYGNNVGGASVHYWADSYRTPADRLEVWAREFGVEGHDLATLTPHFERLERDLHVHPAPDELANRMNELFRAGATSLGYAVERIPQARNGCIKSGHCAQGCAYDAKQSQLVTHIPRAIELGASLFADVRARRLVFEGRKLIRLEADVLDRATGRPTGREVRVKAGAFAMAAGGYGTPTFLLKQGLGVRLPALGKNFFCNPCPMSHARFDEPVVMWRNIPAAFAVEQFRLARFDAAGRYVEGGYLLMPNQLHPGSLAAILPGIGRSHREWMLALPQVGGAIAWIDDAELGSIEMRGDRVRVHVPIEGANASRIRDAWKKQANVLLAAGARIVAFGDARDTTVTNASEVDAAVAAIDLRPARNVLAAPHPGGGCRMGSDPELSVVGSDHRVHGMDNLFVTDPSVFPTPPSVDPSLTIMAFSLVAADAIASASGR